jgi:hypothetical protein
MTNGETFIVVVITLLPFLIMISAAVWGGIKTSKETYEVLYKPDTFDNPAYQYFISIDFIAASAYVFISLHFAYLPIKLSSPSWEVYLISIVTTILFGLMSGYLFSLIFNYWKYTRDVVIQFEPDTKTIYVRSSIAEYILKEDTIESIDHFTNDVKMRFGYWQFKLKNGEEFALTDRTRGVYGIFEYFKTAPIATHKTFVPFIR